MMNNPQFLSDFLYCSLTIIEIVSSENSNCSVLLSIASEQQTREELLKVFQASKINKRRQKKREVVRHY